MKAPTFGLSTVPVPVVLGPLAVAIDRFMREYVSPLRRDGK